MKKYSLIVALLSLSMATRSQTPHQIRHLKITILSTMLAQEGVGDWGFAR